MKIILVNVDDNFISVGTRRIASLLKRHGHEVKTLFLPITNFSSMLNRIFPKSVHGYDQDTVLSFYEIVKDCDVLGFSCITDHASRVKTLINHVRDKKFPKPIVWGGVHASVFPEDAINHADIVCIGEGEKSLLELLEHLDSRNMLNDVDGLWFNNDGKIERNSPRKLMSSEELDSMPFMDYSTSSNFILREKQIVPMGISDYYDFCGYNYSTIFTMGCPFNCTYCSNNAFIKTNKEYARIRHPSVDYIINEIKNVIRVMPDISTITFLDDSFFSLPLSIIQDFSAKYKKEVALPFYIGGIHPHNFDKDKLRLFIHAGLTRLRMGIQSGSPDTLKLYNRSFTVDKIIQASKDISNFSKHLIPIAFDLILDNPLEKPEDLIATIKLLNKLSSPFTLNLFSLRMLPGTQLTKKIERSYSANGQKISSLNFYRINPTYLNVIIQSYGLFKMPNFLTEFLISRDPKHFQKKFPIISTILYLLILVKRGYHHLKYGDYSKFTGRWVRYLKKGYDLFLYSRAQLKDWKNMLQKRNSQLIKSRKKL